MAEPLSDAFVLFGATGDLAFKKIFPALHWMLKRGHAPFPIVGVSRGGSSLDMFLLFREHPAWQQRQAISRRRS